MGIQLILLNVSSYLFGKITISNIPSLSVTLDLVYKSFIYYSNKCLDWCAKH